MAEQPWYHEGLRFGCTGCGLCCTGEEGYVWVTNEEIAALAQAIGIALDRFEDSFVRIEKNGKKSLKEFKNGDCVLWDAQTKGCRAYQARPTQCRTWPFWEQNTDTLASWKATAKFCKGCNKKDAQLFTAEEITQLVEQKFP